MPSQAADSQSAAASPSWGTEQLPAQLRHRGHAGQAGSAAVEEDPLEAPRQDAASMSREDPKQQDEAGDPGKQAAKLAAVARAQANSSQVTQQLLCSWGCSA